jgi:subtilisin family serine protease
MLRLRGFAVHLILTIAVMVAAFTPASTQVQQTKFRRSENPVPDQFIVVLRDQASRGPLSVAPRLAQEMADVYGGTVLNVYTHALNGFAVRMPEAAAMTLSEHPDVAWVETDAVGFLFDVQTNPPWGLDRVDQRTLPLNNQYVYDNTGAGVHVYVIDSGIRMTHVDFGGRAAFAADFVGDGQNGVDCFGHGTHVAGTVGGATYGVAKGVQLRAVRVLDCSGGPPNTFTSWAIDAADWVTANRVLPAVANMSLGYVLSDALDTAVRNSIGSGVTYVLAAGNSDTTTGSTSPQRVGEAIIVAASNRFDFRAGFSNYGALVDLFAPGVGVVSAYHTSDTASATSDGTSMAAPHVAGAAARYLQTNPGASPAQVQNALITAATVGEIIEPGPGSPNRLLYTVLQPPPPSGPTISFQASNGQWMVAEGNGGGAVNANRSSVGPFETFSVEDLNGGELFDGDPVAFRTGGGWYLQAVNGGGGAFLAVGGGPFAHETFTIVLMSGSDSRVDDGEVVALRSANGYYVVAEGGGGGVVNCDRLSIGAWEQWGIWLR